MASKDKFNLDDIKSTKVGISSFKSMLKNNFNGLRSYKKEGKSIFIYFVGCFLEILLGIIFKIDAKEWIFILCMLGTILSIELINTAIEKACDAITIKYNENIKISKDCGSAATFIMFLVIMLLNAIIFYPKIVALF